jgi:hypothetical protein
VALDALHGLAISLATGHHIYLYIDKDNGDKIQEDIEAMRLPAPHFRFDQKVVEDDIRRLVQFIRSL